MSRIKLKTLDRSALEKLAAEGHVQFIEPSTFICFKAERSIKVRFIEREADD